MLDEFTKSVEKIQVCLFGKIYIQFGHVSSCVIRNVSAHIEITDLKSVEKICLFKIRGGKIQAYYMPIVVCCNQNLQ